MFALLMILMLAPGVVAAKWYKELSNKDFSVWDWLYQYAKYIYAITFFNLIVLMLRGWGSFAFESISVIFAIKYLGLSMVLAVILPWINNKWNIMRNRKS